MPKPKRINRTKDEIAQGMENVRKVREMREFVRDRFYPVLLRASTSIDDAKFLLSSFSNMVMEQFLSLMKEKMFEELKLQDKLDKKAANYKDYKELLQLFTGRDVFTARELIEGMKAEVEMMITTEMKERKLETLQTNFFD